MREILFRGKRVGNGEWIEGSLVFNPEYKYPFIGNEYLEYEEGMKVNVWREHYVIPETVGQFTGLTDKNGVKIFEGDKLKDRYGDIYVANWKGVLICDNKYLACDIPHRVKSDFEVIGNIHEL